MKRLFSILLVVGAVGLLLLSAGCDALAVTDVGFVKVQAKKYSRFICNKDFSQAMAMQSPRMLWQEFGGQKKSGEAFLESLKAIKNMDTFYFYVHDTQKLDKERIILDVTMQAHIVLNSMTMTYDNICWRAKMLWIKTDKATWKLGAVSETSARENGSPPQDIKPL
jgi:hypothetical protein